MAARVGKLLAEHLQQLGPWVMGGSEVLVAMQLGSWAWAECRQPNPGVYRPQTGTRSNKQFS